MRTVVESDGVSESCLILEAGAPSYVELRAERDRLLILLAQETERANRNWECVETIACGEKLECVKCGKPRPCQCQDTS